MRVVFAEFERAIQERVRAGIARAKVNGKHCGRPRVDSAIERVIRAILATCKGLRKIAAECGVDVSWCSGSRSPGEPPGGAQLCILSASVIEAWPEAYKDLLINSFWQRDLHFPSVGSRASLWPRNFGTGSATGFDLAARERARLGNTAS